MFCMTLNEKKITGPLSSASVGEGGGRGGVMAEPERKENLVNFICNDHVPF